ncbi:uncharacterized protein TNIN_146931 [Trichonephila inaurata madagascariensis]|uniref:Uncharacterized protein n=1 Tax=Trichonephila inaurata madagascariensis TaxID=2747483 RepID=A0A8X7C172_9ARAC|nr:uncharacterized protein TNIN_146931 [Trichonephila inaurata madagascariensis]
MAIGCQSEMIPQYFRRARVDMEEVILFPQGATLYMCEEGECEWQRGRPSLYVSALWSVLGPREQRHQPPVVLLGEQTIPQVRCPDISMWKNPGCSLGQTKRLPVPGVSHDGGCKLAIIIISLEKVPAQEGFADLQRKVQVHQGWSHECDLEFRLFLQGVRIKAFQKSLSSLKYLEFAAFFSKEKAWKIICAET